MPIKVNGLTNGSVTLAAPDTGSDVTMTLPGVSGELLPLAGGKILQIVRATNSTGRDTNSATYVDITDMSVSIAPQKSDSAILLILSGVFRIRSTTDSILGNVQITDASNNAISGAQNLIKGSLSLTGTGTRTIWTDVLLIAYATPASTSSVTYKARFAVQEGQDILMANDQSTGQLFAIEVSA
jgi:hypothetical protein